MATNANNDKAKKKAEQISKKKNWYIDRYKRVAAQRNWLLGITMLALAGLLLAAFSLVIIADSKTFQPFLIQIDKQVGVATTVDAGSIKRYSSKESIIRSYLARYVLAREGYDPGNYRYFYYGLVRIFSTKRVWQEFYNTIAKSNPNSPLRLGGNTVQKAFIKSITFLDQQRNLALVRFAINQYDGYLKTKTKTEHFTATVGFRFIDDLTLKKNERYFNPLNFQILSYTKETEDVQNAKE